MVSIELSTGKRIFLSEGMEYCVENYSVDDVNGRDRDTTITVLAIYNRLLKKRCFPISQVISFGEDIEFNSMR